MPGLRLIVGFEVRDEDFFLTKLSGQNCPRNRHNQQPESHNPGPGPHCSQCGAKLEPNEAETHPVSHGEGLASFLKRRDVEPEQWRQWVPDASRAPGSLVVGKSGEQWVLGYLIGSYEANKRMAWPVEVVGQHRAACEELWRAMQMRKERDLEVRLMLIE